MRTTIVWPEDIRLRTYVCIYSYMGQPLTASCLLSQVARREKYMCCVSESVQPCLEARKVHGQYIEAIDQQASRIVKLAALKSHGEIRSRGRRV